MSKIKQEQQTIDEKIVLDELQHHGNESITLLSKNVVLPHKKQGTSLKI